MQAISSQNAAIMEVRRRTGAPLLGCRKALEACDGDVDEACLTIARALHDEKSGEKHDSYGLVCHYSHNFGRVGVMVEVACESSYVVKNREFVKLANAIAVHIAWSNPKCISRKYLDQRDVDAARDNFESTYSANMSTKSWGPMGEEREYFARLAEEALEKHYYPSLCLLDQKEMRESGGEKTIGQLLSELSEKVREKVEVKWFARRELGK